MKCKNKQRVERVHYHYTSLARKVIFSYSFFFLELKKQDWWRTHKGKRNLLIPIIHFNKSKLLNFIPLSHSFFKIFLLFYFPLSFSPLIIPSPLQSPHCCPCPWVFFPFTQSLHSLACPPFAVSLLSIYESVSILLATSVCSLDSTHKWNHMVFTFIWLAYFT